MKLWTWKRLEQEFEKYPDKVSAFTNHSPKEDCKTFDEVLVIDNMQCDLVAEVIGCQCAVSMRRQQEEAMAERKTFWSTPREWIMAVEGEQVGSSVPSDYETRIRKITRRYARMKQCHRNWSGKRAGIRCYCDEHNH